MKKLYVSLVVGACCVWLGVLVLATVEKLATL